MIEDTVTVYYGAQGDRIRNLKQDEMITPEMPDKGDIITIDDKSYTVNCRMFDVDSGTVSVLAVRSDKQPKLKP